MKKLLAILVLILTLQTPSLADDIRDFQIEGMSIDDNALNYFSEEKINNCINTTTFENMKNMEEKVLPQKSDIVSAITELMEY